MQLDMQTHAPLSLGDTRQQVLARQLISICQDDSWILDLSIIGVDKTFVGSSQISNWGFPDLGLNLVFWKHQSVHS